APLNLALFHPVNTRKRSEEHRVAVDLSLFYSRVGAIDALAVSAGVLVVERDMQGLTATLIGNLHGGRGHGLAAAGVFSVRGGFTGLSADGLFSYQRGDFVGLQAAGAVIIRHGVLAGAELAGAVALSRGDASGMLASGAVNVHRGSL